MDKTNLTLQTGTVVSSTQPNGYNQMPWMAQLPGQTMDVTIQLEDGTQSEFKQLQPNASIAQYGNVLLAETGDVMAKEIDNMDRQSASIIESVSFHQKARAAYEEMKKKLCPDYAKRKKDEDRLDSLERMMKEIIVNMHGGVSGSVQK